jgi:hypothetical protein
MNRFFGGILLAIGILIAGVSGLCTLVALISSLSSGTMGIVLLALGVGGIPMLIGGGLIYAGLHLLRQDRDE